MGKKKRIKLLKKLAETFPMVMRSTVEYHFLTGKVLKEDMDIHTIEGQPVEDDKQYQMPMPVQIAVNHHRRIKSIDKQHGMAGLVAYAKAIDLHLKRNV